MATDAEVEGFVTLRSPQGLIVRVTPDAVAAARQRGWVEVEAIQIPPRRVREVGVTLRTPGGTFLRED